jgi:hypothetical protein
MESSSPATIGLAEIGPLRDGFCFAFPSCRSDRRDAKVAPIDVKVRRKMSVLFYFRRLPSLLLLLLLLLLPLVLFRSVFCPTRLSSLSVTRGSTENDDLLLSTPRRRRRRRRARRPSCHVLSFATFVFPH